MSSSPENRPGPVEVDPEAVSLEDVRVLAAGPVGSGPPPSDAGPSDPSTQQVPVPAPGDDPVDPPTARRRTAAAPRSRATIKATGRPARATRSTTDMTRSTAVKTTTRSAAEPATRKATKSPEIRPGAPSADALSSGLARLLRGVDEQVGAVTALSTRIDDLVTELNASRAEQAARWAALAQLREVAYDAGLGEVLDPRLAASLPSVEQDPYQPLG